MKKINSLFLLCLTFVIQAVAQIPAHTFTITAPEGADVFVGWKGTHHYIPFTKREAVFISTSEGMTTHFFNLTGVHNYRVSKTGALTQAGMFTPNAANTGLTFTREQIFERSPQETDRSVNSNNGVNVADIFLNINEKGHLRLSQGETFQLIPLRNWQIVDNIVNNYFIEPDFHYTVLNENGAIDNSVVVINNNGLLTAAGSGTAIVLVTYDAINVHSASGGPFFGAIWAENTGVFVVSVDAPASDIVSGMIINETRNTNPEHKMATTAIDAELDIFYYSENAGGFDFSFTPSANVVSVELAQPVITENTLTFNGFSTENVKKNANGTYTIRLITGRNIVRLTSASGAVEYQVLSAKAVNYTISNLSNPGAPFYPGDQISVVFNTLFHPVNKLAGIYNMSAGIQFNDITANVPSHGGIGQYTFASRAQEYRITIPQDIDSDEFLLHSGVLRVNGFGSPFGTHRAINLEQGVPMGLNTSLRTAYFGVLPDIAIPLRSNLNNIVTPEMLTIRVFPNPFTDYIIVNSPVDGVATIYNLSGNPVLNVAIQSGNNRINTSALPRGVYILQVDNNSVRIVK